MSAKKIRPDCDAAGYDVIGDIHGHADKLSALLDTLGYSRRSGVWTPPAGRKAVFVGDLIDRGPAQIAVLSTVREMVEAGHAHCVLGNHEFNAIGFVTPRRDGQGFLRRHSEDKVAQHAEFLEQVGSRFDPESKSWEWSSEHLSWVEWFRTLSPVLDLDGLRVVHAWWHEPYVQMIENSYWKDGRIDDDFLHAAYDKSRLEWAAMEGLTKGQEIDLPDGYHYLDHSGIPRRNMRTKWWIEGEGGFQEVGIVPGDPKSMLPDLPLPEHYVGGEPEGSPILVGHYWFSGQPQAQSRKVAVVDWSAAKDGPLVAYRWSGEQELDNANFVAAGA